MNIIVVGDYLYDIYEKALVNGFKQLNHIVFEFCTESYFTNSVFSRIQKKLKTGPDLVRLNSDLLKFSIKKKADIIFFQRPILFLPKYLNKIKSLNTKIKLISYHNDNPFKQNLKLFRYRLFFQTLNCYHLNYVYRPSNLKDIKKYSKNLSKVLMPYYVKDFHDIEIPTTKKHDVLFIGHYEKDNRAAYCEYLLENNINLTIIGTGWKKLQKYPLLSKLQIKTEARGIKYIEELKSAKIALVFLSKLNKDVYTRRNFEIPVIGTFMLSQRTDELEKNFIDNKDCAYFTTKESLLTNINYFLENSSLRENIALNASNKCKSRNRNNIGAAQQILNDIKNAF